MIYLSLVLFSYSNQVPLILIQNKCYALIVHKLLYPPVLQVCTNKPLLPSVLLWTQLEPGFPETESNVWLTVFSVSVPWTIISTHIRGFSVKMGHDWLGPKLKLVLSGYCFVRGKGSEAINLLLSCLEEGACIPGLPHTH